MCWYLQGVQTCQSHHVTIQRLLHFLQCMVYSNTVEEAPHHTSAVTISGMFRKSKISDTLLPKHAWSFCKRLLSRVRDCAVHSSISDGLCHLTDSAIQNSPRGSRSNIFMWQMFSTVLTGAVGLPRPWFPGHTFLSATNRLHISYRSHRSLMTHLYGTKHLQARFWVYVIHTIPWIGSDFRPYLIS